jgi:hypothetical protein
MSEVQDAIAARRFDAPRVAAKLDELTTAELYGLLGPPTTSTVYAVPAYGPKPDGTRGPLWKVGDGRPVLANEDEPATVAAMAHCAASRLRFPSANVGESITASHASRCGFCDYPLAMLLEAIAHGLYFARLVDSDLLIWHGENGSAYVRPGTESGLHQHTVWRAFAALDHKTQREAVAALPIREGIGEATS